MRGRKAGTVFAFLTKLRATVAKVRSGVDGHFSSALAFTRSKKGGTRGGGGSSSSAGAASAAASAVGAVHESSVVEAEPPQQGQGQGGDAAAAAMAVDANHSMMAPPKKKKIFREQSKAEVRATTVKKQRERERRLLSGELPGWQGSLAILLRQLEGFADVAQKNRVRAALTNDNPKPNRHASSLTSLSTNDDLAQSIIRMAPPSADLHVPGMADHITGVIRRWERSDHRKGRASVSLAIGLLRQQAPKPNVKGLQLPIGLANKPTATRLGKPIGSAAAATTRHCVSCGFEIKTIDPFDDYVHWRARHSHLSDVNTLVPAPFRADGLGDAWGATGSSGTEAVSSAQAAAVAAGYVPPSEEAEMPYARRPPGRRKKRHREPAFRGAMRRDICVECIGFHTGEATPNTIGTFSPLSASIVAVAKAHFGKHATLCMVNRSVFAHCNPGGHIEQAERISHCVRACVESATTSGERSVGASSSSSSSSSSSPSSGTASRSAERLAPLHVCAVQVPISSATFSATQRLPLKQMLRIRSISLKQLQFTLRFVHSARYYQHLCARAARSVELGALVALKPRLGTAGIRNPSVAIFDADAEPSLAQSDSGDVAGLSTFLSGSSSAGTAVASGSGQAQSSSAAASVSTPTVQPATSTSITSPSKLVCQCKMQCGMYDPRAKNISVRQLKSGQTMYEVTGPCSNYKPKRPKMGAKRKRENNRQPLGRFACLAEAIAWSSVRRVCHTTYPLMCLFCLFPALSLSVSVYLSLFSLALAHTSAATLLG